MVDVVIKKLNNVYVKVKCDEHIDKELSEFFSFDAPDSQYKKRHVSKFWDGRIRLYNLKTKRIYVGLVKHIKAFCKMRNYSCVYLDDEKIYPIDTRNIIKSLLLPDKIETRDYQVYGSSYALSHKRCVIQSPTGSGKSLIIYIMLRHLLQTKSRGLLIVPTVNLVEQMYSDFKDYSSENGWDVDKHCQKIYSGYSKVPDKDLVCSTWQSIYEMDKQYFSQFDFIIGDEAHHFQSSSLVDIMTKLVNCDVRIGLTGSLDNSQVHKLIIEGLFGVVQRLKSTKELIDEEHLAELKIKFIILKYSEETCNAIQGSDYFEEIDFIISNKARNNFIANLSLNIKGNTLILFTFVEKHGIILKEIIESKANGRKVFFVYSGVDAKDREEIRNIVEKENDALIIASFGTFSTGVNIKNLHNLIFSSPTKSKIRTLQSIGRILRTADGKDTATLYDIVDDLRSGDKLNFALKHYVERLKIYSEEKHPITTTTIRIE